MRKTVVTERGNPLVLAIALGVAALAANAEIDVVPRPAEVVEREGVFAVPAGKQAADAVKYATDASIPKEGYRLVVTKDGISVAAGDEAGKFYAVQTLRQLEKSLDGNTVVPCVEIKDAPRYPWRGMHLDESRHFFGKETVKALIDQMARFKLNRFHWHLTDDQGWRVDVPGHPELVQYGAWRPYSPKRFEEGGAYNKKKQIKDGVKYGPFYYTEADLREVVAYAKERHIEVLPEIEFPGHFRAALAAYPAYACFPEHIKSRCARGTWGIEPEVMCAGNDDAIKFVEDVLDYVCKVFPFECVHIGGDECPHGRWKKCAKCQARIKAEGLKDEHDLQPWITRHFVKFLEARGKRALGWDEYLLGDVPKSAIGMSWRTRRQGAGHELVSGAQAAVRGHDVVMTPNKFCYLDYGQCLPNDPFQYIGGKLPLETCYSFDPCADVPAEARKHILGGQCNNWSEYTWNEYDLAWKMWPRTCALAEVFWLGDAKPGFADFKRRMATHRGRLIAQGVNCAPLE